MGVRLRRLASALFLLVALTTGFIVLQAWRMDERHRDGRSITEPVDVAIVLAAAIEPDRVLGFSTRRRIRSGLVLLNEGKAKTLLMSGGDVSGMGQSLAEAMRDYAVSQGADPSAILLEDRSFTTFENLRYAVPVAREAGARRIAIVTDHYHLARADALARYLWGEQFVLVAAPGLEFTPLYEQANSVLREALALWYNLGKIAGWEILGLAGLDDEARAGVIR